MHPDMRKFVVRVATVTALVTAFAVASFAFLLLSRSTITPKQQLRGSVVGPGYPLEAGTPEYPKPAAGAIHRPDDAISTAANDSTDNDSTDDAAYDVDRYGHPYPVARSGRSAGDSALIVSASTGTGAAIGALIHGRKGAGIGALIGGVAGLIFDRLTAHPQQHAGPVESIPQQQLASRQHVQYPHRR